MVADLNDGTEAVEAIRAAGGEASFVRCDVGDEVSVRDAVQQHNAKAGSVVVLDVLTGEVLALANYPSYDPAERRNVVAFPGSLQAAA